MIVDAAHFSDGEFEEDIDEATASCREHKVLIVIHSWLFYSTLSPNISIRRSVRGETLQGWFICTIKQDK